MAKQLLMEKYRPSTVEGYVFDKSSNLQSAVTRWIDEGEIPNLFLFGHQGVGKSTLAKILVNALIEKGTVQESDVHYFAASVHNKLALAEDLQKIVPKRPMGGLRIVILEEADRLTPQTQMALRTITEEYSDTTRFIMTGNYPKNIIDALKSRFQSYELGLQLSQDDVIDFAINIIESEGIIADEETFMEHIETYSPDLRAVINSMDQSTSIDGDGDKVLGSPVSLESASEFDAWEEFWMDDEIEFSEQVVHEVLLDMTAGVNLSNFEDYYRVMYENSRKFGEKRASAVITISTMVARAYACASQRMHLDACMFILLQEMEEE